MQSRLVHASAQYKVDLVPRDCRMSHPYYLSVFQCLAGQRRLQRVKLRIQIQSLLQVMAGFVRVTCCARDHPA